MHALRRVHATLAPGGVLVDVRPTAAHHRVVAAGTELGLLDARNLHHDSLACDHALARVIQLGLFGAGSIRTCIYVDRYDDAELVFAEASKWSRRVQISVELAAIIRATPPPYEIHQELTVRVLPRR